MYLTAHKNYIDHVITLKILVVLLITLLYIQVMIAIRRTSKDIVHQKSTASGAPTQHLLANHILTWMQRMNHRSSQHRNLRKQVLISFRLYLPYQFPNAKHCLRFIIKLGMPPGLARGPQTKFNQKKKV